MKKTIVFIILSLLLAIPLTSAYAADTPAFSIKGRNISDVWVASFPDQNGVQKSCLMVRLRDVAEVLGLTVTWYPEPKIATVKPFRNEYLKQLMNRPPGNAMYFSTTVIFKDNSGEIGLTDYFGSASHKMPGGAKVLVKEGKMYVPGAVFTDFLGIK